MRAFGLTYSRFIDGLGKAGVEVDRKVLSDLAIREPAAFKAIVEKAKAALPALGTALSRRACRLSGLAKRQRVLARIAAAT